MSPALRARIDAANACLEAARYAQFVERSRVRMARDEAALLRLATRADEAVAYVRALDYMSVPS